MKTVVLKMEVYDFEELSEYAKINALHEWAGRVKEDQLDSPHTRINKHYCMQIKEINECLGYFFRGFKIDFCPKYATNQLDILDATISINDFRVEDPPVKEFRNTKGMLASEITGSELRTSLNFMSWRLDNLKAEEGSAIYKYSYGCYWTYLFLRGYGEKEYLEHLSQFSYLKKPIKYSLLGVLEFMCYSMLEDFKQEIANSTLNATFEEDIKRYDWKFTEEGQILDYLEDFEIKQESETA